MFVRTTETLAGGRWTGADTRVKTVAIRFGR
jgi:hypothetical protein